MTAAAQWAGRTSKESCREWLLRLEDTQCSRDSLRWRDEYIDRKIDS